MVSGALGAIWYGGGGRDIGIQGVVWRGERGALCLLRSLSSAGEIGKGRRDERMNGWIERWRNGETVGGQVVVGIYVDLLWTNIGISIYV